MDVLVLLPHDLRRIGAAGYLPLARTLVIFLGCFSSVMYYGLFDAVTLVLKCDSDVHSILNLNNVFCRLMCTCTWNKCLLS